MNELAAQKDEILAIKSIFETDNLILDEDCRQGVFLASPVLPDPPLAITYDLNSYGKPSTSDQDKNGISEKFTISHLPPIEFRFELPEKYPSTCPPRFMISCDWLDLATLTKICQQLDQLWEETRGEVLYLWFDFLLHGLISFLEIGSTFDITRLLDQEIMSIDKYSGKNSCIGKIINNSCPSDYSNKENSSSHNEDSIKKSYIVNSKLSPVKPFSSHRSKLTSFRGNKTFDQRANAIFMGESLINRLKQFDSSKKSENFANSRLDCEICYMSFFGSETIDFGCDHFYCGKCIKTYLETCISDGQVHSLTCPSDNCDCSAKPELVKSLVEPELYRKYDTILLSSAIGKLDGVIYCPRKFCLKPIVTEHLDPETNKLVLCPYCDFAFCSSCKYSYHGVSPCKDFADEKEKEYVLQEYQSGSAETKRNLEKLYGKTFLTQQLSEYMNRIWLKEKSKQCPNCLFSIEKIDGCNKIHCLRCNSSFCWICLKKLRSDLPYEHFQDKKSPCYAKLFEGVINDEWEEIDDDDDDWPNGLLFVE